MRIIRTHTHTHTHTHLYIIYDVGDFAAAKSLRRVRLCETPWTAAHQAPLSMGFSRQEYWSGVPLSSPIRGFWYLFILLFLILVEDHCSSHATFFRYSEHWPPYESVLPCSFLIINDLPTLLCSTSS